MVTFHSESVKNIFPALLKAQLSMPSAKKSSTNPHFKSKYADFSEVVEAVRKPLADNGIGFSQIPTVIEGVSYLRTTLFHTSGEWIAGLYPLIAAQNTPQALGSAMTYAKRYSLSAMTGVVADEDDDGNAASVGFQSSPPPVYSRQNVAAPKTLSPDQMSANYQKPSGSYEVTFGKYKDKRLGDIPPPELQNYVNFIQKKAHEEGKPLRGAVADFIAAAMQYLTHCGSSQEEPSRDEFEPGEAPMVEYPF